MQQRETAIGSMSHHLILQDRQFLELSGVSDVDSFDDTVVVAHTAVGSLLVRGRELHVTRLDLEDTALRIEGHIDSLVYEENRQGGFWSRLLR